MIDKPGAVQTWRTALVGALALAALATPAGAAAQGPSAPQQLYSAAQAGEQLDEAVDSLQGGDPEVAEPTVELRDLRLALPSLAGAERRKAKAILARPPAGEGNGSDFQLGAMWSPAATATREHYDTPGGGFRIHYVTSSGDAPDLTDLNPVNGVPDYVELVAARADTSRAVENDELGWPTPLSDGNRGGSGRTDIYLSDLASPENGVLFGYAVPEGPGSSCERPPFRCFAYLVVDNDYAEPGYGYEGEADIPLSATVAHEYNHILQFRLDAYQDPWMLESTAVWAEEKVFPDNDDWLVTYMDRWAKGSSQPITANSSRYYGTAVWNHWLESRYDPNAILRAWQKSRKSKPKHFAAGAYDRAVKSKGGPGFAKEFGRFAAATAEWRAKGGKFPNRAELPNVKRRGTLKRGARAKSFMVKHAAYRLLRVKQRGSRAVRFRVQAPRGVRVGIALVGRVGGPVGGTTKRKFKYLRRGGKGQVRLRRARKFSRITAVVANSDVRVRGFRRGDWNYTRDRARFRVTVR